MGVEFLKVGLNKSITNPNPTAIPVHGLMESVTVIEEKIERRALFIMSEEDESSQQFTIPEFLKLRLYSFLSFILIVDTRIKSRAWSGSGKCTTISMEERFWQMTWVWERPCKWQSIYDVYMHATKSKPA